MPSPLNQSLMKIRARSHPAKRSLLIVSPCEPGFFELSERCHHLPSRLHSIVGFGEMIAV
jgi:hypothetical protein